VRLVESALERVQATIRHALDGGNFRAIRLDGQDGTTLDRLSIKQHRACAAI
jgi:hypothetical protein